MWFYKYIAQNRACILISFKHTTFPCHIYVAGHYKHNWINALHGASYVDCIFIGKNMQRSN